MTALPSSIEAYLQEAGFSGTEISILKKLLEEDALTLRELAAKTGKSTGALDQAMKKLLKKRIVTRETINETPKYILHSLQSVLDWMKDDTEQKQRMMVRKYENFEAFLTTIQKGKQRPEMEYFEGIDGLKRAYMELLNRGKVFLQSGSAVWTSDDDPLRDFRTQYFRERHRRGIFSRVITHDSPLGRRFQSRDPFEYRQTVLVDPAKFPFTFEKIVAGDTVACFQLDEQRACFIRYPELAEEERGAFERLWYEEQKVNAETHQPIVTIEHIPLKTRIFSRIRDLFLSRRNIEIAILLLLVVIRLAYALYNYTYTLEINEVSKRLMAIAATAAPTIDANDLNQLHFARDMHTEAYQRVFKTLNLIRDQNKNVRYVFVYRPTDIPGIWEFVADADSNYNLPFEKDYNGDGIITSDEQNIFPGERYDMIDTANPTEYEQELVHPMFVKDVQADQWGMYLTGSAPIKDKNGKTVAVLCVDIAVENVYQTVADGFKYLWVTH